MQIRIMNGSLALLAVVGCSGNSGSNDPTLTANSQMKCIEPKNPWSGQGGGHEAGFNWAEENGEDCPSEHGQSFEEGCTEYYDQRERFEKCGEAKKRSSMAGSFGDGAAQSAPRPRVTYRAKSRQRRW